MKVVVRYLIRDQPLLVQQPVDNLLHKSVLKQPVAKELLPLLMGACSAVGLPLAPTKPVVA